jgi:valyl-tRNA synthetase
MELPKNFDWATAENRWYQYWLTNKYFKSTPDEREPYTIVIPPPNVTGVLHMGHMLNNTIQDVLIRKARMQGKNACWVPGTDHASIATEAKVVAMLKEKGINKSDLSRDEFLKYAWEWKEKYGGIILSQLQTLGASCDWDRTRFTMEDDMSQAVIDVFIDMYNKGHIYRGVRMVNWDPQGLTALSDEEVIHKEADSQLVYIKYYLQGSTTEFLTVATTRPETIMGDTALCVNPTDERYQAFIGKQVTIPLVNRTITVIADEYVDKEFGTGVLKVTPAHDINDYNLGIKHKLKTIDVLTNEGKISDAAGLYVGLDRFACRKQIIKDLTEKELVVKIENTKNKVGYSERTNAVIEPKLSMQWFLKMENLATPALENVMNDNIQLFPDKFKNTYRHWMENVRDWCISRQLWWGQRIPAWYNADGDTVVCNTLAEAEKLFIAKNQSTVNIHQDEDVLDTWFSSWLWPISVFDGFKNPEGADINYYYPTNDLVTAPEILFFWVARMVMAGYEYKGEMPFKRVYLTGIVRDKQGRKMSKSLGNSPDPLDLITQFGADGVRMGLLMCSPAGNDLLYDDSYCEQGRNFTNKVWNAYRLIQQWKVDASLATPTVNTIANEWFESKFNQQLTIINDHYDKLRMSDAAMATYKLVWDDFCAWYLEMVKPAYINGEAACVDAATYTTAIVYFEKLLKLMHPFMPFVTEELWHIIKERSVSEAILISAWPVANAVNTAQLAQFEFTQNLVSELRNVRNSKGISPKEKLNITYDFNATTNVLQDVVIKLANIDAISNATEKPNGAIAIALNGISFYVPLTGNIDVVAEREKLTKELEYNKGFLSSVMIKLSNEKFVANAKPELIANETKKKSDAENKIKQLEEELLSL